MKHHLEPEIGCWFEISNLREMFEVVAADEFDATIEIQYFSGEIEEIELENWFELDLKAIPAPEDCSGPFEVDREDLGYFDNTLHPEDWSGPLMGIEPEDFY